MAFLLENKQILESILITYGCLCFTHVADVMNKVICVSTCVPIVRLLLKPSLRPTQGRGWLLHVELKLRNVNGADLVSEAVSKSKTYVENCDFVTVEGKAPSESDQTMPYFLVHTLGPDWNTFRCFASPGRLKPFSPNHKHSQ